MIKHPYFKEVIQDEWGEFYCSKTFKIPFIQEPTKVKLMVYDEDFEPIEEPIHSSTLDEYAETLKNFLTHAESIMTDLQQATFEYYLKIYAKYYEKPFEVLWENELIKKSEQQKLHQPLQINTKEKHFQYIIALLDGICISNNKTIVFPFSYCLDNEHGIEVKIRNNQVIKVGGVGETTFESI